MKIEVLKGRTISLAWIISGMLSAVTIVDVHDGQAMPPVPRSGGIYVYAYLSSPHEETQDSLSTITTDTGAFAPGNRDFTHYTTPELCVAAVEQASDLAQRDLATQQQLWRLWRTPELDTLPARARQLAQTCGSRFAVERVTPMELPALARLALQMGNDTMARAAVQRQLALADDDEQRLNILAAETSDFLAARPTRMSDVEWLIARADTVARASQQSSKFIHGLYAMFAQKRLDWTMLRRAADGLIVYRRATPAVSVDTLGDNQFWSTTRGYEMLSLAATFEHPDSIFAIAQRATKDIAHVCAMGGFSQRSERCDLARDSSPTAMAKVLAPSFIDAQVNGFDLHHPPPPVADYWYPASAKSAAWPPRGAVTLVVYDEGCVHYGLSILENSTNCQWLTTHLHDWLTKYGPSGLAVTIVENTQGMAVRSGPLGPQQEADSIAWFFQDYLKLPVTVAVTRSIPKELVPVPDGRLAYLDTTNFGRINKDWMRDHQYGFFLLFGRDGNVVYGKSQSGWNDWMDKFYLLGECIKQVMSATPTAPVTTPGVFDSTPVHLQGASGSRTP